MAYKMGISVSNPMLKVGYFFNVGSDFANQSIGD